MANPTEPRKRKYEKTTVFNDPIHGHIELPEICVKIINTPEFLRLRNIKQLGATYQVFPGAAHNRFEHCIGVSYLAGEFGRHLKDQIDKELDEKNDAFNEDMRITQRDIICLQVAGLCHDIGHGPMSHVFESRFVHKLDPDTDFKWEHEDASCDMFDHILRKKENEKQNEIKIGNEDEKYEEKRLKQEKVDKDKDKEKYCKLKEIIKEEIETQDKEFIKNLIHYKKERDSEEITGRNSEKKFLYETVSNEANGLDVDKFDYLARDSYHLGFKNNFDHKRLIKFSSVRKRRPKIDDDSDDDDDKDDKDEDDGAWHICYRDKQVEDIYHMFLSRIILHQRACMHKTVQVLEQMYMEVLIKANDVYKLKGKDGKECTILESTKKDQIEAYAKLTDDVFFDIQNSSCEQLEESRKILTSINKRDHYKLVSEAIPSENSTLEFTKDTEADEEKILEAIINSRCVSVNEGQEQKQDQELKKNLLVLIAFFYFGRKDKKDKNPVDRVYFYNKDDRKDYAFRMKRKHVSSILPKTYSERHIRLYIKCKDEPLLDEAKKRFKAWCTNEKMNGKWKFDLYSTII